MFLLFTLDYGRVQVLQEFRHQRKTQFEWKKQRCKSTGNVKFYLSHSLNLQNISFGLATNYLFSVWPSVAYMAHSSFLVQ